MGMKPLTTILLSLIMGITAFLILYLAVNYFTFNLPLSLQAAKPFLLGGTGIGLLAGFVSAFQT